MNKQLARISMCSLNISDRSILTINLHVDYENGLSQNICGLVLDTYDKQLDRRIGTAYGCEFIRQLLVLFNCDSLEDLVNRDIFILGEGEDINFKPKGIQLLRADGGQQLIFDNILQEFNEKSK